MMESTSITKIHWEIIRKVQKEIMDEALQEHEKEQHANGYKPRILAIDEFALHTGHSYATCVMDIYSVCVPFGYNWE